MTVRDLPVSRWRELADEVNNIRRHLHGTALDHWEDSLKHLAQDCTDQIDKHPTHLPVTSHTGAGRAALIDWLGRSGALTGDQSAEAA